VNAPALELDHVTKRYGDFLAVDDVSFSVPAGSIHGFLGPNGAGKTTTLRMILEIIKPTRGSLRVLGHSSALEVRERIGYLPEEKGLYKKMKAWAIIAYFATLKGLSRRDARQRALQLLDRYGLGAIKAKLDQYQAIFDTH
jgi:ABC-2 type transport system ATP-binding protein